MFNFGVLWTYFGAMSAKDAMLLYNLRVMVLYIYSFNRAFT